MLPDKQYWYKPWTWKFICWWHLRHVPKDCCCDVCLVEWWENQHRVK